MKLRMIAAAAVFAAALLIFTTVCAYARDAGSVRLPVLMYHHFAEEATSDTIVTGERFREHMTALKNAGYASVTVQQMLDYVENGAPLPDKPVLITMDDGYTSNLDIAGPILEDLGMCATVFVIGVNEGEEYYVHSGEPFWQPRFSYEEAAPWVEKGVLDFQSHSMDMHQLESYGYSGRDGMLPLAVESDEAYRSAVKEDAERFRQRREGRVSTELIALAYPFGYYSQELDHMLEEEGFAVTFTIEERCNRLRTGNFDSLRMLGRYNVTDWMTGETLAGLLSKAR